MHCIECQKLSVKELRGTKFALHFEHDLGDISELLAKLKQNTQKAYQQAPQDYKDMFKNIYSRLNFAEGAMSRWFYDVAKKPLHKAKSQMPESSDKNVQIKNPEHVLRQMKHKTIGTPEQQLKRLEQRHKPHEHEKAILSKPHPQLKARSHHKKKVLAMPERRSATFRFKTAFNSLVREIYPDFNDINLKENNGLETFTGAIHEAVDKVVKWFQDNRKFLEQYDDSHYLDKVVNSLKSVKEFKGLDRPKIIKEQPQMFKNVGKKNPGLFKRLFGKNSSTNVLVKLVS